MNEAFKIAQEKNQKDIKKKKNLPPPSMENIIIMCVLLLIISLFFSFALFYVSNRLPSQPPTNIIIEADKNYKIILKQDTNNLIDFYLVDNEDNEALYLDDINLYYNHYHPVEFINNNLYYITRLDTKNKPVDELWHYNDQQQSQKIFTGLGTDFRVSPDNNYIAIIDNRKIYFWNNQNNTLEEKKYTLNDIIDNNLPDESLYYDITFENWTKDSQIIWIIANSGVSPHYITSINKNTSEININNISNLNINSSDFAFNPNNKTIIYSDYPALFDLETLEEFKNSDTIVNIYEYSLKNQKNKLINSTNSKKHNKELFNSFLQKNNDTNNNIIIKSFK